MTARRSGVVVALVLTAALGGGATWVWSDAPDDVRTAAPVAAVRTSLPGLTPAAGDPEPPALRQARPRPGTVVRVPGPFDDRFTITGLALTATHVSGALRVTSDVSDLLALQVAAGFYDENGRFLGLARYDHRLPHHDAGPGEPVRFTVAVPAHLRDRVAAAAVTVPVLVNE